MKNILGLFFFVVRSLHQHRLTAQFIILGTIRNTLDGQTRRLVILPNIYVLVLLTPGTGKLALNIC